MKIHLLVMSIALLVLTASSDAVTLISPPVQNDGNTVSCNIFNVSADPVEVTVTLFDHSGDPITTNSGPIFPGVSSDSVSGFSNDSFYCVFTFSGKRSSIRGYIRLFVNGNSVLVEEAR
ncbi:hypothetical protein L0222_30855 [bacterium]|nr:hypothetical protein [bacterium]